MSEFWKNSGRTVILLAGVAIGAVSAIIFGDKVNAVKPIGDIFLNLVFTLVVPLVLFSVSSSICKLHGSGRAGKVIGWTVAVFAVMSVLAGILAFLFTRAFNIVDPADIGTIKEGIGEDVGFKMMSGADAVVKSVSVPDFGQLLSKANMLPLIVFSLLLGLGTSLAGEKGKPFADFLESGMNVTMKIMSIIMKAAPIGLGCYFACTLVSFGSALLTGYFRITLLYCVLALAAFLLINSLYMLAAGGRKGFLAYWKHILPPSVVALSTCSSAAAIPGNINAARLMGVDPGIADAVIPFGTNIHKDGSMMAGVFKIVFLMALFGQAFAGLGAGLEAVGIAILSAMVMGAVTAGGMTGELLICTMLGLDPAYAGIIVIFGTLIDMPSTMVNSSSNVVAAVLVDKLCK